MRVRNSRRRTWLQRGVLSLTAGLMALTPAMLLPLTATAAGTTTEGFSLQVSPSPLVATVEPGVQTSLDLQIRNTSTVSQDLKMGLRSFTVGESNGEVKLGNSAPADVAQFVSFSDPIFSVQAGQIFTQHVSVDTPSDAGFTYSFAVTIAQQNPPTAQAGTSSVRGSVAVFTLLSVDRPGAVRKVNLEEFSVSKHVYEYLPATFSLKFHNTGNTLAQPSGTIFIQRGDNDNTPIDIIPVNKSGGYIIPGSSRILASSWNDGFPHYGTTTDSTGKVTRKLSWAGGDFTKMRFGRYTAKLVAVYNDGTHDIPLQASVTFWVIPWRLILAVLVIVALLFTGLYTTLKRSSKAIRRPHKVNVQPPKS